jgi:hypothetical protein
LYYYPPVVLARRDDLRIADCSSADASRSLRVTAVNIRPIARSALYYGPSIFFARRDDFMPLKS